MEIQPIGFLAMQNDQVLPLEVLQSAAGFYLGTRTPDGFPNTRESDQYFISSDAAILALASGDWIQKPHL